MLFYFFSLLSSPVFGSADLSAVTAQQVPSVSQSISPAHHEAGSTGSNTGSGHN